MRNALHRRVHRVPLTPALVASAYRDGRAQSLIARARAAQDCSPQPLLLGLLAATMLLPRADPAYAHQWLTAAALTLSGRDRVYLRDDWQPAQGPYVPPCAPDRVRFAVLCT